jgi:hypothetical protein
MEAARSSETSVYIQRRCIPEDKTLHNHLCKNLKSYTEFNILMCLNGGTRSWLRHYATSRKVAGSISDEVIGFFNWPKPSSRTMALGSTQPVRKMSTRNLPEG